MTQEEIRWQYILQLNAELEILQLGEDAELGMFLEAHPERKNEEWAQPSTEFMNEYFKLGDVEWVHANTFRLWPPGGIVIDIRILDLMNKPNVVWWPAHVGCKDDQMYIDVTMIDGDEYAGETGPGIQSIHIDE